MRGSEWTVTGIFTSKPGEGTAQIKAHRESKGLRWQATHRCSPFVCVCVHACVLQKREPVILFFFFFFFFVSYLSQHLSWFLLSLLLSVPFGAFNTGSVVVGDEGKSTTDESGSQCLTLWMSTADAASSGSFLQREAFCVVQSSTSTTIVQLQCCQCSVEARVRPLPQHKNQWNNIKILVLIQYKLE